MLSRRDLLKSSAVAAAGASVGSLASASNGEPQQPPVSDGKRLKLGIIGCGGKGWSGMQQAAQFGDVVALADIDAEARVKASMEHPRASSFEDYREMLLSMRGKIDSVVISTPDHHHAIAAAMAMKQGLHVYCEKPLTRTIWEARQLQNLAKSKKIASQMGNQSTASSAMRKTAAAIKAGHFGAVKEIHLWTDRAAAYWKQGLPRPATGTPKKTINFELWLGPAPERPYGEGYHPFSWRGWWDFGTGALGDMGCHIFNMPFMALDLRDPLTVQAQTSGHNRDSFPEWSIVHYEFGARNGRAPVTLHWYDGGKKPDPALAGDFPLGPNGSIVVCEKGTIFSPNEGNTEFHLVGDGEIPDVPYEKSPGHMAEFARAALGGQKAMGDIVNYAGPLTETVLLGNLAIWADGPKLEWDAKAMKVKGTNEFDSLIKPSYRKGWSL